MTRVHIRCSKERCKLRYSLPKHPDFYKRQWKCAGCGGTKFRVIKHWDKERGNILCICGAYAHWQDEFSAGPAPHRRGSPACWFDRDGTPRTPDPFGRATYSCPHDGIPRWPALYCAEATRPSYSRWHFGWQATQTSGGPSNFEVGELHVVHYIVPLAGKLVCGLHWHVNMQVMHWKPNAVKGCGTWPDMPFEQLELL